MCTGGELLADFRAGTLERPDVPDIVGDCLTTTVAGEWVVWAHKHAYPVRGRYMPLSGGEHYPVDAVATCRRGLRHQSPDPGCTCGFHALSQLWLDFSSAGVVHLEVALTGRVLAFAWPNGGVLLRASRQTVMRIVPRVPLRAAKPDDPEGRLAMKSVVNPRGAGPVESPLPRSQPPMVMVTGRI
jgi:hypothetical protein